MSDQIGFDTINLRPTRRLAPTASCSNAAHFQAGIDATLKIAFDCARFAFAVGNHIPGNVPVGNARFYFGHARRHWTRTDNATRPPSRIEP